MTEASVSNGADLKRIDDFIKLLAGLVIGQFLRDAHLISKGLRATLDKPDSFLCEAFPFLFAAFVIRNVHASFRYDAWIASRGFSPKWEKRVKARAWSFLANSLALFVSTIAVEHFLSLHLTSDSTCPCQNLLVSPLGQTTVSVFIAFLILPFSVYLLWDLIIWILTDTPGTIRDRIVQEFIRRWLLIDAAGMAWLLICLTFNSLQAPGPPQEILHRALIAFSVLAFGTVIVDYLWNLSFYFSKIK